MTKQNGDNCGWPTADDTACRNPATGDDGRCWIPSHGDESAINPHGRPSKFNQERAQDALEAARMSKAKSGCARAAGVDLATLNRWLEANPDLDDGTDFRLAFARARRDGETVLVQGGLRNDEVDTSMAKFLLSTSFGYVKTERREVGVDTEYDFETDGFEIIFADERE